MGKALSREEKEEEEARTEHVSRGDFLVQVRAVLDYQENDHLGYAIPLQKQIKRPYFLHDISKCQGFSASVKKADILIDKGRAGQKGRRRFAAHAAITLSFSDPCRISTKRFLPVFLTCLGKRACMYSN